MFPLRAEFSELLTKLLGWVVLQSTEIKKGDSRTKIKLVDYCRLLVAHRSRRLRGDYKKGMHYAEGRSLYFASIWNVC